MGGPDTAPHTPQRSGRPGEAEAPLDNAFVAATPAAEVPPGKMKWVVVDRERVLVANVDGTFYAIRDICGHRHENLSKGTLFGYVVECPLHFACFDVRNGTFVSGPVSADVPSYEVRLDGETVYVKRLPRT